MPIPSLGSAPTPSLPVANTGDPADAAASDGSFARALDAAGGPSSTEHAAADAPHGAARPGAGAARRPSARDVVAADVSALGLQSHGAPCATASDAEADEPTPADAATADAPPSDADETPAIDLAALLAGLPTARPETRLPDAGGTDAGGRQRDPRIDAAAPAGAAGTAARAHAQPADVRAIAQRDSHRGERGADAAPATVATAAAAADAETSLAAANRRAGASGAEGRGADASPVRTAESSALPAPPGASTPPGASALPATSAIATVTSAFVPTTGNAPAPTTPTATPNTTGELQPPVGSPHFAPALGTHVVTLVRNGIEQAEVRLNPAELGPVAVHIRVEGSQAQVEFSAAHAATRQALQDAVPALAGALRESGLTLTGGGVFEQPRDQRDAQAKSGAAESHDRGAAPVETAGTTLAAARLLSRVRGVLDVFA